MSLTQNIGYTVSLQWYQCVLSFPTWISCQHIVVRLIYSSKYRNNEKKNVMFSMTIAFLNKLPLWLGLVIKVNLCIRACYKLLLESNASHFSQARSSNESLAQKELSDSSSCSGSERQPSCFINSLGDSPLISCLGRRPDSEWEHITAHLHVSWFVMTQLKAKKILFS